MDFESNTEVKDNGKCDAENSDAKLRDSIDVEGTIENKGILPGGALGLSPSPATKGIGLRKWRRIQRPSGMETNHNFDGNKKRGMTALPVRMKQNEGSSSSTNVMQNVLANALDHISGYEDLSSRKGPDFASRADSENSRSSTAASGPRGNHELPAVDLGFNLTGKSASVLVQNSDLQEKVQNLKKKARGVKIKKENSISSMESDSRSSNFVFLQAANSITSNGRSNGKSRNYDGDESDEDRDGDILNRVSQTTYSKNGADFENVSPEEDLAGENSWEVKEEQIDGHVVSGDPESDPLADTIIPLHLAQEALEREVQKLKDVGKEDILSSDDYVQPPGFKSNEALLLSKLEQAFNMLELKNTKISELESTLNFTKIKTEYEELFTKRIAAEVEYLVILKTIQNLKAGQIDPTSEQKNVCLTTPAPTEAPARAPKLEDAKKLRNMVWRYGFCAIIQLVLLLLVLYIFVLKFSSKTVEVIPT